MNRFSVLLLAAFSLLACGAPLTPQSACEEQVAAQCDKMWNCNNSSGLKIGTDEASCKTQYKSLCALASSGCASGKTFDQMNAMACNGELKAQSCAQYASGAPSSCQNQCK